MLVTLLWQTHHVLSASPGTNHARLTVRPGYRPQSHSNCAAPMQGGLGLRADQLALPLSICGGVLVLFALLIYPRLQARMGTLQTAKAAMLASSFLVMLLPCSSLLQQYASPRPGRQLDDAERSATPQGLAGDVAGSCFMHG